MAVESWPAYQTVMTVKYLEKLSKRFPCIQQTLGHDALMPSSPLGHFQGKDAQGGGC